MSILTIEMLRDAKRKLDALGPPPPRAHLSKYAPVFDNAKPTAAPRSDDMRQMCDDIGPQKVPVAWRLSSQFGEMIVVNPANVKEPEV